MWSGLRILGADGGGTVDRLRELLESLTDLSNSLSGTFSPLLFHLSCQVSLSLAQVNQAFSHTDASAMPGDILCGDIGEVTDMHDDKWPRLGAGHRLGIMRTHDPGCNTQIPWRSWEAPDERPIPPRWHLGAGEKGSSQAPKTDTTLPGVVFASAFKQIWQSPLVSTVQPNVSPTSNLSENQAKVKQVTAFCRCGKRPDPEQPPKNSRDRIGGTRAVVHGEPKWPG